MTATRNPHTGRFQKVEAIDVNIIDEQDHVDERYTAFKELFGDMPEVHRPWAAFLTGLSVAVVGGWAAGVTAQIIGFMVATLTGSALLAYFIAFISCLLGIWVAIDTGNKAALYIARGELDRDLNAAKSWVTDKVSSVSTWFKGVAA